jgi:hypothetical protein
MLRACVLTDGQKWGKHLPLAKFSYNNSYQESIKMPPFEALYGWPCHTPLSWFESHERVIFGPDTVTEAEKKVKHWLPNLINKAILIRGAVPWNLKWVITYTFESPQ